MADELEVMALLKVIAHAYPTFEVTEGRIKIYAELLADVPLAALKAAVVDHIATNKFPPTVAELRVPALNAAQTALPSWTEAWQEAVQVYGGWSPGKPARQGVLWRNDLARQAAEQIGGWWAVIATEQPEVARAHFRDAYNALASRARTEAAMTPEYRDLIAETRQRSLRIVRDERTGTDDV